MNLTIQVGRFTRDPEVTYGDNQAIKCVRVDIAVPRDFTIGDDDPKTDFFHCVAFKAAAKFIALYCKKGDKVILRGRFQNNNYTKNDGTKVYGDQLIIDKIEFAQTKPDQTEENFHPPDEDEEMPFKD